MVTKIFALLFCLLKVVSLGAQSPYAVYHVRGPVTIQNGKTTTAALRGAFVPVGSTLLLGEGGSCMLIVQGGLPVQLDRKGAYSYKSIATTAAKEKARGVSSKFFSYVYDNLVKGKREPGSNVTPVVYRGSALMQSPAQYSLLRSSDSIHFKWNRPPGGEPVSISIRTEMDSILMGVDFTNAMTSMILHPPLISMQTGVVYKWIAEPKYNAANNKLFHFFVLLPSDKYAELAPVWQSIDKEKLSPEAKTALKRDLLLSTVTAVE